MHHLTSSAQFAQLDQPTTKVQDLPESAAAQRESRGESTSASGGTRHRGLLLIGLFKLSKCSLAVLSGVAAYHLTHVDPGELALRVIDFLPINPVGRLAMGILDEADSISSHGLRQLGMASFVLATLYLIEGAGLMAEKVWAEYFTVVMTAGALPLEIHELVKRYTDVRLAVLLLNAAVVVYLAVLLRNKRKRERGSC